jgi:hypothetical protein
MQATLLTMQSSAEMQKAIVRWLRGIVVAQSVIALMPEVVPAQPRNRRGSARRQAWGYRKRKDR